MNRASDHSQLSETGYAYGIQPGEHRPDPHSPGQAALGPKWGDVTPFTYPAGGSVPLGAPPGLTTAPYAKAFKRVYTEGRDDIPRLKPDQAVIGIFWGYDGSQKLGTPPRFYNQIARVISQARNNSLVDDARLFALINVGMADAGISAWHWKYVYNFWRPVVGIREAGVGSGPTCKGDGNTATKGDPFWCPLGAPDTNGTKVKNFTPGFPAYPSGHSTFGTTCFMLIAKFYSKPLKDITFTITSDEFNGVNRDSTNVVRPKLCRRFNLAEAIKENGESRIFLGVHWDFDNTGGQKLGEEVAKKVFTHFNQPHAESGAASRLAHVVPEQAASAPHPAIRAPFR
jgi:hypothetical protein